MNKIVPWKTGISLQYIIYLISITLWATLAFALPDFLDNPVDNFKSYITIAGYLGVIYFATLPLMIFATSTKTISAIFVPLYAILGSIVAYYRVVFHATITVVIIDAVFNTNAGEASGVMTIGLFAYILLNVSIALSFVYWRYHINGIKRNYVYMTVGVLGVLCAYNISERVKQSLVQRYPYNIYFYGNEYYTYRQKLTQPKEMVTVKEISPVPDSLTVVFILGESIRYDHLSINGYNRETTPSLKANGVISMGDVYNPYTDTNSSIPYIMTPADDKHRDDAQTKESFISYYKDKGFLTQWISNQDMGTTYSYFIKSTDSTVFVNGQRSIWTFDSWTDEALLPPFKDACKNETPKNLIIMHTIGAHWYYNLHYPDRCKKFTPITTTRVVTDNAPCSVINSYDNCIVTMDHVVGEVIQMLKNRPAIIFYQSDHGESLGENGAWLHASEGEMMHHPASFIWLSNKFKEKYPQQTQYINDVSLQNHKTVEYVFPLMLRIIGLDYKR